jgi:transcriptional regulator with XRE-family HTH domain
MLESAQIKAARSLLGWHQDDLARHAKIGIATIQRIEKADGPVMGNVSTQLKIQQAFERAGIRFIDNDASGGIGVRLDSSRPKGRGKPRA